MLNGAGVAGCITIGDSLLIGKVAFLSKGKSEVGDDDAENNKRESGMMMRLYHRIPETGSTAI